MAWHPWVFVLQAPILILTVLQVILTVLDLGATQELLPLGISVGPLGALLTPHVNQAVMRDLESSMAGTACKLKPSYR